MNKLLVLSAAALFTLSGCVVQANDVRDPVVIPNYIPEILASDAGVYYDAGNRDDIWFFEATVDDLDGPLDVTSVWADVYDDVTGVNVESFELYPTDDPTFWFSDWLGSTTLLDPYYPYYSVDIVAYDTFEDYDAVTILPTTY